MPLMIWKKNFKMNYQFCLWKKNGKSTKKNQSDISK